MNTAADDLLITLEGNWMKYSHEEMLTIIDDTLQRQVQRLTEQAERLGGTVHVSSDPDTLRSSPLGQHMLSLIRYLENASATHEEKRYSREVLGDVLHTLYGLSRLPTNMAMTEPLAAFINDVRVKDTKLPEVVNVREALQFLNTCAAPRKFYLPDIYGLIRAGTLWPLVVNGKRRYFIAELNELCTMLAQSEQEQDEE